jgi:diguanylate cyclase (GGDEF)-like protein
MTNIAGGKQMIWIILVAMIVIIDRIAKILILGNVGQNQTIPVIDGFFNIVHTENTGAALGILQNGRIILVPVTIIAAVIMGYIILFKSKSLILKTSLSLILGGAFGNLIDRMFKRVKESLKLLRETNEMALSDEISKLPNHRAARINFERAINEYKISRNTFSILFIDGDNLKRYNDTGYENGNNMIKSLGELISKSIRKDDMIFRWFTGDEFIVLLKNTDKKMAYILAERIRATVEQNTQTWTFSIF